MAHELLLVFAGFGSGVFGDDNGLLAACHPSERSLVERAHEFGKRHAKVRDLCGRVRSGGVKRSEKGYTLAAHAVALAVEKELLGQFAKTLETMESDILNKNSAYVGGDNTVPATLIVSKVTGQWEQRFKYAEELMAYVAGAGQLPPKTNELVDALERDVVGRFGDVRELATACLVAAQRSWLHDVAVWVLYGRLADHNDDFFVGQDKGRGFVVQRDQCPQLLNSEAATDVLDTGMCIVNVKVFRRADSSTTADSASSNVLETIKSHREMLDQVQFPLEAQRLAQVLATIKESTYQKIVMRVLPLQTVADMFAMVRRFVLLGSPEWVRCLLDAAREGAPVRRAGVPSVDSRSVLRSAVDTFGEDASTDADRELARLASKFLDLRLAAARDDASSHDDRFDDLLLNVRTKLHMSLQWPFSIFVTTSSTQYYAFIFAFLASFAQTMGRVADLWRGSRQLCYPGSTDEKPDTTQLQDTMAGMSMVNLFLSIMWEHYQRTVLDGTFGDLERLLAAQTASQRSDPAAIIDTHARVLTTIVDGLFIRNFRIRSRFRSLFVLSNTTVEAVLAGTSPPDDVDARLKTIIYSIIDELDDPEHRNPTLDVLVAQLNYALRPPPVAARELES